MKYMQLGKTGIEVSRLGLGAWAIGGDNSWGKNDDNESIAAIREAIDSGFTLIDTAPAYGLGHGETVVGKAIKDVPRDKLIISTKCGLRWHEGAAGHLHMSRDGVNIVRNVSAGAIREDLEKSLSRLGLDYVDIYLTHWQAGPEYPTPVSETAGELVRLKKEGKIRAIGASNVDEAIIKEYLANGELDVVQQRYTMLDRGAEALFGICKENDIMIMAYSPLEQGLLTGAIKRDYVIPQGNIRGQRTWFQPQNLQRALDMLDKWDPLCEKYGCTKAQLAIAWTLAQAENLNILCGARKVNQVKDNAGGADVNLSDEDVAYMRGLAEALIPA